MCCFSQSVQHVSNTSIFCRMGAHGNQVVIYSMLLESANEVAMVLPVPVSDQRDEDSVQFVDFSNYKSFFPMLDRAFPDLSLTFGGIESRKAGGRPLQVQQVGSYAASFVPTVDDFDRLDPRFRISREIWQGLSAYLDHGFVVFQLRAGKAQVHPMAFAYPARDTSRIVFPTVHIHDGEVRETAKFDHALYCQTDHSSVRMNWEESIGPMHRYINVPATKGLVRADEHVYKKQIVGEAVNEDVVVSAERA